MLSFKAVSNSGGALHYFESTDDYYAKEGHKGEWLGDGAKALGLEGGVKKEDFKSLLDGYLPDGEKVRKSHTANSQDRKGIDFTFSAPKSVSIQALVNGDERVLRAHDEAVKASLIELQKLAVARKKEKGISFREHTNELVIASFRHELSRAQDPQLHTHNIVMNLTRREDGQWRALSNEEMLNNVKVIGAFYRAELAQNMKKLGYEIRTAKRGEWELAHIDDKAIKHFSKRSEEIEELLKRHGRDRESVSGKEKQMVTLLTRPKKTEEDRAFLHSEWLRTAKEANIQLQPEQSIKGMIYKQYGKAKESIREKLLNLAGSDKAIKEREAEADKSIKFAIDHLTERQGIVTKSEVLSVAYAHGAVTSSTSEINQALERAKANEMIIPELTLYQSARSMAEAAQQKNNKDGADHFKDRSEDEKLSFKSWVALTMVSKDITQEEAEKRVKDAIARGVIVKAEERYVTKEARRSEVSILAIERAGRNSVEAIATPDKVKTMLSSTNLNEGQKSAVELILTTENRFVGIQGFAGSGKSHMLSKAVDEIRNEASKLSGENGYKVIGLAPYASQNRALEELGMESKTLASFLASKKEQSQLSPKSMIVLDEAGVVPAHQMEKLMRVVEEKGARLVLVGDNKQTQAVEAGKPFVQLQEAGMSQAFLTEIQRQKNKRIKMAVIEAATDKIPSSIKTLDKHITEVKDSKTRYETIAKDYVKLPESDRNKTLIVVGTNEARREINSLVRENLGVSGGKEIRVLNNIDMTRAEAREARSYKLDMIIVPERTYAKSIVKDVQYRVSGVDAKKNELSLVDPEGKTIKVNPATSSLIRAYEQDKINLAGGEWIRITRNDKSLDLRNGERYQVVSATEKNVVVKQGEKQVSIPYNNKPLNMQYGYATTVHSAQGLTSDRVLIDADVKSKTSNKSVFYVAISRPRHDIKIYTNDKQKLSESMNREPKKYAALELRDPRNEGYKLQQRISAAEKLKQSIKPNQNVQNQQTQVKSKTFKKDRGLER